MDIERLRAETRHAHDAVESSLPLLRSDLDRRTYIAVLQRMYPFVSAWEHLAEASASEELRDTVTRRSRRHLLAADLLALKAEADEHEAPSCFPALNSPASLLGALYVMEGSRLGGQMIARHVRPLLDDPERESSYFAGYRAQTAQMWRDFLELVRNKIPETQEAEAVSAAKAMFACFGDWMRHGASWL